MQVVDTSTRVAFLGPQGTFSHSAVLRQFPAEVSLKDFVTIDEVFTAVENGEADFGVVPVENSTEGAVNNTQDCLVDTSLKIVGEVIVPIEHHFLFKRGTDITRINKVVSHKQSLAQCRKWLVAQWPNLAQEEVASNAEAARRATVEDNVAAIAGEMAATIYGLEIAVSRIQDQRNNSTRFLVLSKSPAPPVGKDKTSILVYTENRPGALFRILEPFERNKVSLTKIETRPSKKEVWDYVFFIDFEGHVDDEPIKALFEKLKDCTAEVKVLGSYPMASPASVSGESR
ncbi:MAG: prephenate dehydratase [Pseudohongiellaceae bacterium]